MAHGPRCRAGPFPAGADSLAAAAEWLHEGARVIVWDMATGMLWPPLHRPQRCYAAATTIAPALALTIAPTTTAATAATAADTTATTALPTFAGGAEPTAEQVAANNDAVVALWKDDLKTTVRERLVARIHVASLDGPW